MTNAAAQRAPSYTKQDEALQSLMHYVARKSPYYRSLFEQKGITPSAIQRVEDLEQLPFTTKTDLQLHNEAFYCIPKNQIIDYCCTSGTLGKPVNFILTDKDLNRLAYNEQQSFAIAGLTHKDTIQICTTIDKRFMAGLAYFLGARKLGAGIIRVGSASPEMQWNTILELRPTALITVPSFILKLIDYAEAQGIDYQNSSIKKAICIGESIRAHDFSPNVLARRITEKWNLQLHSTYASTEMGAAFTECGEGRGGHQQEDLIITELVDKNGQAVPPGTPGELVVTTLGIEGMPLLRFKTGDICTAFTSPCSCGNSSLRLGPVIGRKNQMLKFKGTTVFVPAIYNALNKLPKISAYQVEARTSSAGTDDIIIYLSMQKGNTQSEADVAAFLKANIRVRPKVVFQTSEEMQKRLFPKGNRKPKKFLDGR